MLSGVSTRAKQGERWSTIRMYIGTYRLLISSDIITQVITPTQPHRTHFASQKPTPGSKAPARDTGCGKARKDVKKRGLHVLIRHL